jgi:ER degradation enhancer, mannosidase alpha-like 1
MSSARRRMRNAENHTCPAYKPVLAAQARWDSEIGLVQGIKSRPDVDYVRELAGILPGPEDERAWEPHGSCEKPQVDQFVSQTRVRDYVD